MNKTSFSLQLYKHFTSLYASGEDFVCETVSVLVFDLRVLLGMTAEVEHRTDYAQVCHMPCSWRMLKQMAIYSIFLSLSIEVSRKLAILPRKKLAISPQLRRKDGKPIKFTINTPIVIYFQGKVAG